MADKPNHRDNNQIDPSALLRRAVRNFIIASIVTAVILGIIVAVQRA